MTERLYCYSPQKNAAATLLCPAVAKSNIYPVSNGSWLQFAGGGTFIIVAGHPSRLPRDIWEVIEAQGWVTVTIDDGWARHAKEAKR